MIGKQEVQKKEKSETCIQTDAELMLPDEQNKKIF